MKKTFLITAALLMVGGFAQAEEQTLPDTLMKPQPLAPQATAEILGADGEPVGGASFYQGPLGVLAEISVRNLPPGKHGLHMHSVGTCDHNDHFKSASGHINPTEKEHGYLNPNGPDYGDLPNLIVAADGTAKLELFIPQLDIMGDGKATLLDEDGSALMIHENPDDHKTQPIGGAGARIACGVVVKLDY